MLRPSRSRVSLVALWLLFLVVSWTVYFQRTYIFHQQIILVNVGDGVDRSMCCRFPSLLNICGKTNCNQLCPHPKSAIPDVSEERAFFLETSGAKVLNIRQSCAVESLAFHNPNLTVYVLFTGGKINFSGVTVKTLGEKYENIRLIQIHLDDYLAGTPLEYWYHCTDWKNGSYHVSHLSDGLRFLTLAKFGGFYFDLDVIHVRPVTNYRNFVSVESSRSLASAALHAEYGHPLMQMATRDFPTNYQSKLWTHNGPALLMRVLKRWCKVKDLQSMNDVTCKGVHILPKSSFSPVHYSSWKVNFQQRLANETDKPTWLTNQVIGVHMWNKLSFKETIYKNSTQHYTQLARTNCPQIFYIAPDIF